LSEDEKLQYASSNAPIVFVWKLVAVDDGHLPTTDFASFFKSCFPTALIERGFDSEFVLQQLWRILRLVVRFNLHVIADACMDTLTEWARKSNDLRLFTRRSTECDNFCFPTSDTFGILTIAIDGSFEMIPKLLDWIEWTDCELLDAFERIVLNHALTLPLDSNRAFRCKTLHALRHGQVDLEEHLGDVHFVLEKLFTRIETLPEKMSEVFLPVYLLGNTPRILLLALQREHEWSNDVLSSQVLNACDASNRVHVEIAEKLMLPPLQLLPDKDAPGWLSWLNEKLYAPGGAGFLAIQSQHPEMNQDTETTDKRQRT
jgi:hypothetical protein